MTRMAWIEGGEYHAVPSRSCMSRGIDCYFIGKGPCTDRVPSCSVPNGAAESVVFIHPGKYPTWLANRIRGVE